MSLFAKIFQFGRGCLLPGAILAVGLAITQQLWLSELDSARQELHSSFDARAREAASRVEQRLMVYEQVLRGVRGFFAASREVDRDEFRVHVASLQLPDYYPGIQGIGYALTMPAADKDEHVAAIRRQGFPDYAIKPDGQRESYTPVIYLEPFSGANQSAFGDDMYAEPALRAAMEHARDSGKTAITGKLSLPAGESGLGERAGFFMYLPVYAKLGPYDGPDLRRANLRGWVYARFLVDDLMLKLFTEGYAGIRIQIYDGEATTDAARIYDNVRYLGSQPVPLFQAAKRLDIAGRTWLLAASSLPGFESLLDARKARIVAYSGCALSALLMALTWLLIRGRNRALWVAQELNRELLEREKARKALQESEERWKFALEGAGDGVWDWCIADNTVTASPRWKEMLGYSQEDIGDSLQEWESYIHPDDLPDCYASLNRHLQGETPLYLHEHRMRCKDGSYRWFLDRGMVVSRSENGAPLRVVGTHSDITERKRLDDLLKASEAKLRLIMENITEVFWMTDIEIDKIFYISPGFERVWHRSCAALYENPHIFLESVHADDRIPVFAALLDDKRAGRPFEYEYRIIWPDGTVRWIWDRGFPVPNETGEATQYVGLAEDITELKRAAQLEDELKIAAVVETQRKLAEAMLQRQKEQYRLLLNSIGLGIFGLDLDGKCTFCNTAGLRLLGYQDEQALLGKDIHWSIHHSHADGSRCEKAHCKIHLTLSQHDIAHFTDEVFWRADGTYFPVEYWSYPQYENSGVVGAVVTFSDISRRKEIELSNNRLLAIIEESPDLIATADSQGQIVYLNRAGRRMLGIGNEEDLSRHSIADKHPRRERERVVNVIIPTALREGIWTGESAVLSAAGEEIPVSVSVFPHQDTSSHATYVTAIARDISERKIAEKALLLAAKVFESSSEAIVVTDSMNTIVSVNPAFSEITGYSAAEAIGQNPRILKSGRHDEDFYRRMWDTLNKTGHWQGEIWDRRKNGEIYPKWTYINSITADGKLTNYVAVFSDITERKATEEHIQKLAHYDTLTGLPNRLLFHARLEQALALAKRNHGRFALLFIDLDRFKHINDSLGHAMGDQLLVSVGNRLQANLREMDTVARFGGDEFAVILNPITDLSSATLVAQKLLDELEPAHAIGKHSLVSTPSIGIVLYPQHGLDAETLLKNADAAMYCAKEKGRNNYEVFREEMNALAQDRTELEADLRIALEQRQLAVFYQAKVDMATGRITGVEALARWLHPAKGMITPDRFIPLAEETGLIIPIGEWVLRTACLQAKNWHDQGLGRLRMAVNISARQLQDPQVLHKISGVLQETGLPPACLELELTESLLMRNVDHSVKVLRELKSLGVSIAVDDFGTGYSCLNYLKRLPVDVLKIDQSFVRDISTDPEDRAIIQAIISLAHALNLEPVAEGVETQEQEDFLRLKDCHIMQGYLLGRPIPAEQFEEVIKAQQGGR